MGITKALRNSLFITVLIPCLILANEPTFIADTVLNESRELTHEELYFLKKEQGEFEKKNRPVIDPEYARRMKRAQVQRGIGIGSIGLGSAALVISIPMLVIGLPPIINDEEEDDGMGIVGAMGLVPASIGIAGITSGIFLLDGANKKIDLLEAEISFTPLVNPFEKEFGAQLSISF